MKYNGIFYMRETNAYILSIEAPNKAVLWEESVAWLRKVISGLQSLEIDF